jgi:hypothetical protein
MRMKSALLWMVALAIGAALLVGLDYRSRDPDSALYARLSGDLARRPAAEWIAPQWGGAWNQHGLFREHPVGILLPSVLLIRAGFPPDQAAYAVNMLYQAAVILLLPLLAGTLVRRAEALSLAWMLQWLPVSFVYRIRGNQEHPLLMCFLALVYATHRARLHAGWLALMAAALCWLVLVKGAFATFALVAAALWILVVPPPDGGSNRRAWSALLAAAACAAAMASAYELIYARTTGESFIDFYRSTRLGESMTLTDPAVIPHAARNVFWYLVRLLWFAAPWSLAAFAAAWVWARRRAAAPSVEVFDRAADAGLLWALLVAIVFIAVLSPANVRAERFIFPLYFIAGAAGVVAVSRSREAMQRIVERTSELWWLPASTWLVLFLASIGSKLVKTG